MVVSEVLCGQINLQKGKTGVINLMSHLDSYLQTGSSNPTLVDGAGGRKSFIMCVQEPPVYNNRITHFGSGQFIL